MQLTDRPVSRYEKKTKYLRWLFEFLVCLYCCLLYTSHWPGGDQLRNAIDRWIVVTDRFMFRKFAVSVFHIQAKEAHLSMAESWILALLTFAGVRLLGQIRPVGLFLPLVGLCLTVAGPLYFDFAASDEWRMGSRVWMMRLEIVAMIAILLRYGHRKSPAATFLCSGALVAHFWDHDQ